MYKYLYGKWDVLRGLVEGNSNIRFCDIRHYSRLENNEMRDDEAFKNSELTSFILKTSGYTRYEISNYSIPGHQSRHNRVYWKGLGWWSFGQGSTSSPWGENFTRPRISKDYKKWVNKN